MPELWYNCFFYFITRVYFARLTLLHPERLPKPGQPVLFLGLHRNGAVDGFAYYRLLGQPAFLISTQLTRSWFARLFFHGIAVTRKQDEGEAADPLSEDGSKRRRADIPVRSSFRRQHGSDLPPFPRTTLLRTGMSARQPPRLENDAALDRGVKLLQAGGRLFVFPEGTSSLGPRHLPFKNGAAWLILDYLESGGPPLLVIPVGIHYECPWAFRSKVEVVLGRPVSTEFAFGATRLARLRELKRRIETGLEEVGINVESDERQERIQRLAYAATLATPRSYFHSLKSLEREVPKAIVEAESDLESEKARSRLHFHQGVPLMPMAPTWIYALLLLVCAPIAGAAILFNLPPFLAGWFAGRRFPDDRNVISLWKILVGIPALILWLLVVSLALLLAGKFVWLGLYGIITWLGLLLYYRVRKLAVAVYNGLRCPQLKPRLLAFRQTLLNSLPE
jgi:1-acyl-sn-glycerol-3-phosphate acyltransferase